MEGLKPCCSCEADQTQMMRKVRAALRDAWERALEPDATREQVFDAIIAEHFGGEEQ